MFFCAHSLGFVWFWELLWYLYCGAYVFRLQIIDIIKLWLWLLSFTGDLAALLTVFITCTFTDPSAAFIHCMSTAFFWLLLSLLKQVQLLSPLTCQLIFLLSILALGLALLSAIHFGFCFNCFLAATSTINSAISVLQHFWFGFLVFFGGLHKLIFSRKCRL